MKINGTNIILLNENHEVLLQLRDNKPDIPYPNMWALPGGHVDERETPLVCIFREIKEELGRELHEVFLFAAAERSYGTEHTYWTWADFGSEDIRLTEGQEVRWFTSEQIRTMDLIYEDNAILEDFFTRRPFACQNHQEACDVLARIQHGKGEEIMDGKQAKAHSGNSIE